MTRIERIEDGNFGDHSSVGGGISELRIHVGQGYRVYYIIRRRKVVILLCGGDKSGQQRDIYRRSRLPVNLKEALLSNCSKKDSRGEAMKLKKFDVVDFLDSDEALVEYLNAALAGKRPELLRQGARERSTRQRDVLDFRRQWSRAAISLPGTIGRRQPPDRYTVQSPGSPEHQACHRGEQMTASFSSLSVDRKKVLAVLAAGIFSSRIRAGRQPTVSSRGASGSPNKIASIADVSIRREPTAGVCALGERQRSLG